MSTIGTIGTIGIKHYGMGLPTPPFRCPDCPGSVSSTKTFQQIVEYIPDYMISIPEGFVIPTCDGCGTLFTSEEIEIALDEILFPLLMVEQKRRLMEYVDVIQKNIEVIYPCRPIIVKDIANLCGVKYQDFRRYLEGTLFAPITVSRLLRCFAQHPETVRPYIKC